MYRKCRPGDCLVLPTLHVTSEERRMQAVMNAHSHCSTTFLAGRTDCNYLSEDGSLNFRMLSYASPTLWSAFPPPQIRFLCRQIQKPPLTSEDLPVCFTTSCNFELTECIDDVVYV